MAGSGRWGGMELVPGALTKLSATTGSVSGSKTGTGNAKNSPANTGNAKNSGTGKREPTPPSRSQTFRGESSAGLQIAHSRSGSDTLDPRGVPPRPTGSMVGGGRPLSGGSRSSSRGEVNLSTSPNPTHFQPYQQEATHYEGGPAIAVSRGGGGGGGSGGSMVPIGDEFTQRCVIIQRGEKGYGLTVSGDNPVFVQDVKPHGAAARAGVHPGDRIMKVNGTLVTSSNHVEVVRMIKSGSLVSLTLLSKQPNSTGHARMRQSDHVYQNDEVKIVDMVDQEAAMAKVQNLKKYLDKALVERNSLSAEYKKLPNDRNYGKILENNRTIEALTAWIQN